MEPQQLRALLGKNIRLVTAWRGLTLARVAAYAGISEASLNHALAGRAAMTVDRLAKIANVLELEPKLFFERDLRAILKPTPRMVANEGRRQRR